MHLRDGNYQLSLYANRVRSLGQELVNITEDLVLFEQQKMTEFIANFKISLV